MPRDGFVKLGLGKHGLIQLIVSKASIANHINDHISAPLVPPLDGSFQSFTHSHGIVTIDMEYRTVECFAEIGRVGRGSTVDGVGREADLIIDNDMDGSPNVEVVDASHLHRFVDDALSGEGGVSVKEDGHDVAIVQKRAISVSK